MTRWRELETREALDALSVPAAADPSGLSRRRFLQAALASAGATTLLPSWLDDVAAAATPIGANDGVLVVVLMAGGNDGLNTVIPLNDGKYRDVRGSLAIGATSALKLDAATGLHPNLPHLQARYKAGQVAALRGVGDMTPDMSHFTAMARWMSGGQSASSTGWLGRWLDGYARADDLSAVVIGESIPLAMVGAKRKATALPATGSDAITAKHDEGWVLRSIDCLRELGAGPTGNGAWADALGSSLRGAIDLGDVVKPAYSAPLPEGKLLAQLELAARLVNANLGVRVIQVQYGDFDHHANEAQQHATRMTELDAGIDRFFATLSPAFARRTTILTLSEFGRRPVANDSGGTDHGEASDLLAIGPGVKGGMYGEAVHLDHLSEHGCPMAMVDFRSVYTTVLQRWLGADATQVLGGRFEDLGFLRYPTT
jgi:uncharacterized protein (DUF1501 family)